MTVKQIANELDRVAKEMRDEGYHDGNDWLEAIESARDALKAM